MISYHMFGIRIYFFFLSEWYIYIYMRKMIKGMIKIYIYIYIYIYKYFWHIYIFPVIFTYKKLNFWYSLELLFNMFMIWKHLLSFLLTGFTATFLFFIQSKVFHVPLRLKFSFWHFLHNKLTQWNMKSLPFIDASNSIWDLESSYLKSSLITSSALSWLMISMLLLF